MRRCFSLIRVLLALVMPGLAVAETATDDQLNPLRLYGDGIDFDVIREGEKIGIHEVRFDRDADGWNVRSLVDLEVRFLALFVFRYRYEAHARWVKGELQRLRTDAIDDGERSFMIATRSGDVMQIRFKDQAYTTEAPIIPTNHWNADVLGKERVLNTITGNVNEVRLVAKGREPVSTERGDVIANRYTYTGDLVDTEVWYDDAGRWVKLRFLGRDGTPIEYACRRCQGGGKVSP